jgi:hypothetical protein
MEKPVFIHKIAAFSLIFLWQRFAFLGIEIGAKSTLAHFGSFCSMFFTQTSRQIAEKKKSPSPALPFLAWLEDSKK